MTESRKILGFGYGRGPGGNYKQQIRQLDKADEGQNAARPSLHGFRMALKACLQTSVDGYHTVLSQLPGAVFLNNYGAITAADMELMLYHLVNACCKTTIQNEWDGVDSHVVVNNSGRATTSGPGIPWSWLTAAPVGDNLLVQLFRSNDLSVTADVLNLYAVPDTGQFYVPFVDDVGRLSVPASAVMILEDEDLDSIANDAVYTNATVAHGLNGSYGIVAQFAELAGTDPMVIPWLQPVALVTS